jgi:hypothetical protein
MRGKKADFSREPVHPCAADADLNLSDILNLAFWIGNWHSQAYICFFLIYLHWMF